MENVKLQTLAYRALQEEENGIDQLKKSNSTDDSNSAVGRQNENRVEEETASDSKISSSSPIRRQ